MLKLSVAMLALAALSSPIALILSPFQVWARSPALGLMAKKPPKPVEVSVSEVKLTSENIAGAWFHTLTGKVLNQSDALVNNVVVYYEIYSEAGKIVDAGSVQLSPPAIAKGGQGEFSITPNAAGRVKITLVRWQKPDRSSAFYTQMQLFP